MPNGRLAPRIDARTSRSARLSVVYAAVAPRSRVPTDRPSAVAFWIAQDPLSLSALFPHPANTALHPGHDSTPRNCNRSKMKLPVAPGIAFGLSRLLGEKMRMAHMLATSATSSSSSSLEIPTPSAYLATRCPPDSAPQLDQDDACSWSALPQPSIIRRPPSTCTQNPTLLITTKGLPLRPPFELGPDAPFFRQRLPLVRLAPMSHHPRHFPIPLLNSHLYRGSSGRKAIPHLRDRVSRYRVDDARPAE